MDGGRREVSMLIGGMYVLGRWGADRGVLEKQDN